MTDVEVETAVAFPYRETELYELNPYYQHPLPDTVRDRGLPPLVTAVLMPEEPPLKRESPPPSIILHELVTPVNNRPVSQMVISPRIRPAIIETGLEVGMRVLSRRLDCGDYRFEGTIIGIDDEGRYIIDFGYDDIEVIPGGYGSVIRHPKEDARIFRIRS